MTPPDQVPLPGGMGQDLRVGGRVLVGPRSIQSRPHCSEYGDKGLHRQPCNKLTALPFDSILPGANFV